MLPQDQDLTTAHRARLERVEGHHDEGMSARQPARSGWLAILAIVAVAAVAGLWWYLS